MGEFELIERYFANRCRDDARVTAGIGDDAALVQVPAGYELASTTDTLVAGVHFPAGTEARDLGYKALAVNLSDLAAMGATPAWFLLSLTLEQADPVWLQAFTDGLFALAHTSDVVLIGGNTTRGPLSITITALGLVPTGCALRRNGAMVADEIYVTGWLGDAALGLAHWQHRLDLPEDYVVPALDRLLRPEPRVAVGQALRGIASAAIDISDGLVADLGHLLEASRVGARVRLDRLPLSPAYDSVFAVMGWEAALTHGDDYELCFTVSPANRRALHQIIPRLPCGVSLIGVIEVEAGLRLVAPGGGGYVVSGGGGHDHFRPLS